MLHCKSWASKKKLIIFSSDNGPILDDGYEDKAEELVGGHRPNGSFRGGKYSAYEAGTQMPTITYWPCVIKSSTSDAMVSQIDLFASLAKLTGQKLKSGDAPTVKSYWMRGLGKQKRD